MHNSEVFLLYEAIFEQTREHGPGVGPGQEQEPRGSAIEAMNRAEFFSVGQ